MPLKVPITSPDRDIHASASPFFTTVPTSGAVTALTLHPLSYLGEFQ